MCGGIRHADPPQRWIFAVLQIVAALCSGGAPAAWPECCHVLAGNWRARPKGAEFLVAGYFNTDVLFPVGHKRDKTITVKMATEVLEGMEAHLLPLHIP